MRTSLLISSGFHLLIFLFVVFGLPFTSPRLILDHRVINAQVISETQAPKPKPVPPPPLKKAEKAPLSPMPKQVAAPPLSKPKPAPPLDPPKPKKVSPMHRNKNVEIFGLKFKGSFELHETLGILLIDKNI